MAAIGGMATRMIAVNADQSPLAPRAQRALERLRATAYCG
jgi:hypothetical protein